MSWKIKCASLCLLASFGAECYFDHLPPENNTATSMYPLKRRILRFARTHNRIPERLADLPPAEDFINRTTDVWGNEIQYVVESGTIELISYGKNQKPGGVGDDLDVIGVFEAKTADGNWRGEEKSDYNSDWKVLPLIDNR